MKNIMIAAAAMILAMTGLAVAQDLSFGAYSEYSLEAKTFELGGDVAVALDPSLTLMAGAEALVVDSNVDFNKAFVGLDYAVSGAVTVYGRVETNSELHYADGFVGLAARF